MGSTTAVPSKGRLRAAWEAIDERLGISSLAYPVPVHANRIGYILGGISFFGFIILAATGIWLAQYYHATSSTARESVVYIMNVAPGGDVIRGCVPLSVSERVTGTHSTKLSTITPLVPTRT